MQDLHYLVTTLQENNEEDEEEEEAPSLCDLPISGAISEQRNEQRCSISPSGSFEFLPPNISYSFAWNDLVWPSLSSTSDKDLSVKTPRFESFRESKIANRSSTTSSGQRLDRANISQKRSSPWYWLVVDPLKFRATTEIEMRSNAKIRKSRSPTRLFPVADKASCHRSSWRLISALSCKNHGSVAVSSTTSFHPYC